MMRTLASLTLTLTLIPLALVLAGCGKDGRKDQGAGTAQGEILPGSVSDAMIPVDQVKSQPPLAPKSEGGDKKEARAKAGDKPAGDASPAAEPAEAPAAEAPAPAAE